MDIKCIKFLRSNLLMILIIVGGASGLGIGLCLRRHGIGPNTLLWTADNMATSCKQCVNTNLLVILTIVGGAFGLIFGFILRKCSIGDDTLLWTGILGEMYIRMLKMMIIPLIVSSIITATASLDMKTNGRISAVSLVYLMLTNLFPSILGTILCILLEPGRNVQLVSTIVSPVERTNMETQDIFADLLRNIFPENIVVSTFQQAQTKYLVEEKNKSHFVSSNISLLQRQKILGSTEGTNVLGLIVASSLFGMATSASKEHGKAFFNFFTSATSVILKLLRWLVWFTPIGVTSLLFNTIASSADASDEFKHLGMFILTVLLGVAIWSAIVVPINFFIVKRTNPFRFLYTLTEPILIVFATGSCAIAMPETLHCLEVKNKLDSHVTRYVIPLAATIGRSGTCLYINISCLFIIQLVGLELTASRMILVCILSTVSALANPSVTGSSLVNIIIILTTLDIPPEAASLLYAFDWLLDRFRSIMNLYTNVMCAVVSCSLGSSSNTKAKKQDEAVTDDLLNTEINV